MSEQNYSNSSKTRPDKVQKGGRSIYCCIPDCGSSFYDNENNKTGIGLFKFPKEKSLRQSWIRAVNQVRRKGVGDDFRITSYTRVCEFHFKPNDINVSLGIGRKTTKANAVPIFKNIENEKPLRRSPRKRTISNEDLLNNAMADCSDQPEEETKVLSEVDTLKKEIFELKQENLSLKNEVETLKFNLQKCEKKSYNYENVSKDEKLFKSETGLEAENFDILYKFLNPGENCSNIKMYNSKQKNVPDTNDFVLKSPKVVKKDPSDKKQGPAVKLTARNQLFLYLTWLKGGFSINHASWLFNLPKSTISRYIITWSNFVFFSLGSIPIWPSKKVIEETMPDSFKETYPKTRCIIDCTELFCQRPSSLASQSHMYSHYKSHVTYKGLIGIAPSGAITFVSQLYEGSISDKEIVKRSGFLTKEFWGENDSVMADRGFTIEEELNPLNVSLNIPAFLGQKDQLSEQEVKESQTIASVRIHVERAIQRVKKFRQLRNEIPLTLHGSINQIWTVACLLCNFMSPLIQKDLPRSV